MSKTKKGSSSRYYLRHAYLRFTDNNPSTQPTVSAVSSLAGVTRATFYNHYDNIEELKKDVTNHVVTKTINQLKRYVLLFEKESIDAKDVYEATKIDKDYLGRIISMLHLDYDLVDMAHAMCEMRNSFFEIEDPNNVDEELLQKYSYYFFGFTMAVMVAVNADDYELAARELRAAAVAKKILFNS